MRYVNLALCVIIFFSILLACDGGSDPSSPAMLTVNIKLPPYSAAGDGVHDDSAAFTQANSDAYNWYGYGTKLEVYLPNGTYNIPINGNWQNIKLIGQSRDGVVLTTDSSAHRCNILDAENVTFLDIMPLDYVGAAGHPYYQSGRFKNCKFKSTAHDGTYYMLYLGSGTEYVYSGQWTFEGCVFQWNVAYAALWINNPRTVQISNCVFGSYTSNGNISHSIRIVAHNEYGDPSINPQITITDNTITGGKTGILLGTDRIAPIYAPLIERNTLVGQNEESISLDGFGNNSGLVPTICNGPIASVSNDNEGRVVIGMGGMTYYGTEPQQPSPVSLRSDWPNFYFSFGQGSGQEGTISRIHSYDAAANTITLDLVAPAASITVGGDGGVQAGFFNPVIRDNVISGALGLNNTYATAISAYLNVFGALIEGNTITGCAHAINLAGGLMLSTYYTLAYNNIIRNNTILDCDLVGTGAPSEEIGAVRLLSYYGGHMQYNNQFTGNTVRGGRIYIEQQGNLLWEGNNLQGVTILQEPNSM